MVVDIVDIVVVVGIGWVGDCNHQVFNPLMLASQNNDYGDCIEWLIERNYCSN